MDIVKEHLHPSNNVLSEKSFAGEPKSDEYSMIFKEGERKPEASDGFIALDITRLSLLLATSAASAVVDAVREAGKVGAQAPFTKKFSKKGWQRGGERKAMESSAAVAGKERTSVFIDVANEDDSNNMYPLKTPAATTAASNRCQSRRRPPWLHPRRVLVLFASLSSMGTLILLYFTLSMGKMPGNSDAR